MKIAIITRNQYRSPKFLANSLSNMLKRINIKHDIYYDGLNWLHKSHIKNDNIKLAFQKKTAQLRLRQLLGYDLYIISDTMYSLRPIAPIEYLKSTGKPILFYEVFYPGGSPYCLDQLPANALSRFDGYLTTSALHDSPVNNTQNIHSIGLDLSSCQPLEKPDGPFTALLDFEREGYEKERELQLKILKKLKIHTIILNKEYTFNEINTIYNKANIYFLASHEAFGVPIAQLQLYGCLIASPSTTWVRRHALRADHRTCDQLDKNEFSNNFVFYSSESDLTNQLLYLKEHYDSKKVKHTFLQAQPKFSLGDPQSLWEAIYKYTS